MEFTIWRGHPSHRAAVVGEPLDRLRRVGTSKASLSRVQHKIADHLAADAAGTGTPRHRLRIVGVQGKSDTDHFTVRAGDLAVKGPTQVWPDRGDLSVARSTWRPTGEVLQQQSVVRHKPVDALVVQPRKPGLQTFSVQQGADTAIAVRWPLVDQGVAPAL